MSDPYLYAHENRNAPRRANGKRFWGYPARTDGVRPRLIVVHTAESVLDLIGPDAGAEGVARYQAQVERPSSYHRIVDRDSTVVCLPDDAVSFGVVGLNTVALNLSLAMQAADWSDPDRAAAALPALKRAAHEAGAWAREHRIPVRRLITEAEAKAPWATGIVGHGTCDPDRRSDPGDDFPWAVFLELTARAASGQPVTAPVTPTVQEDVMQVPIVCLKERTNWLGTPETGRCTRITAESMAVVRRTGAKVLEIDSEAAMKNALRLP